MELSSQNSGNVEISHGSQQHTEGVMWSPPYHALENLSLSNMILVPWFPTLHPEPATVEEQAKAFLTTQPCPTPVLFQLLLLHQRTGPSM